MVKFVFVDVEIPIQETEYPFKEGVVYVCKNDMRADLKCPCGCQDIISLPLNEGKPMWKINGNSITPSINRTVGCRSHFTITNGFSNNN